MTEGIKTEHSPLPWRIEVNGDYSVIPHGAEKWDFIMNDTSYYPTAPSIEDARFIVKACNAHDDLVSALMLAREWAQGWLDNGYADQDSLKADLVLMDEALEKANG